MTHNVEVRLRNVKRSTGIAPSEYPITVHKSLISMNGLYLYFIMFFIRLNPGNQ